MRLCREKEMGTVADYPESRKGKSAQNEHSAEGGNQKQTGKGLALVYLLLAMLALAACICVISCHAAAPNLESLPQFSAQLPEFPEIPEIPEMPGELREALDGYTQP